MKKKVLSVTLREGSHPALELALQGRELHFISPPGEFDHCPPYNTNKVKNIWYDTEKNTFSVEMETGEIENRYLFDENLEVRDRLCEIVFAKENEEQL